MSTRFGEVFPDIRLPHFTGSRHNRISSRKVEGGGIYFTDGELGGVVCDGGRVPFKQAFSQVLAVSHNALHLVDETVMRPLAELIEVSVDESLLQRHHDEVMGGILFLADRTD